MGNLVPSSCSARRAWKWRSARSRPPARSGRFPPPAEAAPPSHPRRSRRRETLTPRPEAAKSRERMSRPSGFRARALQGQARRSPRLPKAVGFTSSPEERRAYHASDDALGAPKLWPVDGAGPADGANGRAAHSPLENRRTPAGLPHRPPTAHNASVTATTRRQRRTPRRDQPIMRSALPVAFPSWRSPLPCHWKWNENTGFGALGVERNTGGER